MPVTLEGCYQFCSAVYRRNCRAYRFTAATLRGPARCDLYTSRVAYALDTLDPSAPGEWYDLDCGSPTLPRAMNRRDEIDPRGVELFKNVPE